MRNIVYLIPTHFYPRDFKRFGVEASIRRGYATEVWTFARILNPGYAQTVTVESANVPCPFRELENISEALALLERCSGSTYVVNLLPWGAATACVFKKLKQKKIPSIFMRLGDIPVPNSRSWPQLWKKIQHLTPRKAMDYTFKLLVDKEKALYNPIAVASGQRSMRSIPASHAVIPAHAFDYDVFLDTGHSQSEQATAVFLDEYLPYHPDYAWMGITPYATADQYYPPLRRLFGWIEKTYGLKVVIAAHPRSDYTAHGDVFGGREVVMGKTAELIRDCSLVLAHFSTSVNFATLYRKPVVFVTSNALDSSHYGDNVRRMAHLLCNPVVCMDREDSWTTLPGTLTIDPGAYSDYVEEYIKTKNSPDRKIWDIVFDTIDQPDFPGHPRTHHA